MDSVCYRSILSSRRMSYHITEQLEMHQSGDQSLPDTSHAIRDPEMALLDTSCAFLLAQNRRKLSKEADVRLADDNTNKTRRSRQLLDAQ